MGQDSTLACGFIAGFPSNYRTFGNRVAPSIWVFLNPDLVQKSSRLGSVIQSVQVLSAFGSRTGTRTREAQHPLVLGPPALSLREFCLTGN
jgi:hypothetical protein